MAPSETAAAVWSGGFWRPFGPQGGIIPPLLRRLSHAAARASLHGMTLTILIKLAIAITTGFVLLAL